MKRIEFKVVPSPDANDFCLQILVEGIDFIRVNWPDLIGIDPPQMFRRLLTPVTAVPREMCIARCGCGVEGCGSASVMVAAEGGTILWDRAKSGDPSVRFDAKQYRDAVSAAISDISWEPRGYTAARLLEGLIDRDALRRHGFEFDWASDRVKKGEFVISLRQGENQTLISVPVNDEPPSDIAATAADMLRRDPSGWAIFNYS